MRTRKVGRMREDDQGLSEYTEDPEVRKLMITEKWQIVQSPGEMRKAEWGCGDHCTQSQKACVLCGSECSPWKNLALVSNYGLLDAWS